MTKFILYPLLLLLVIILITGCTLSPITTQKLTVGKKLHPLVNTIYSNKTTQKITEATLLEQLKTADVIYLGEHHNNIDHHQKQLEVIKKLVANGKKPMIGFETFALEQTSILLNYNQLKGRLKKSPHLSQASFNSEDWLKEKLQLSSKKNQTTWEYYGPIIKFAFENELPLFGMDLNKNLRHQITKHGINGLSALEKRLLHPTGFKNNNYRLLMHENFKKGHCGWGKPEYLDKLYDNWLARNDSMAMAITEMAENYDKGPVVAILGAAHTQFNMGVYERVNYLAPNLSQANLSFVGVRDEIREPTAYTQQYHFNGIHYGYEYDYVWLTKGLPPGRDMCGEYIKQKKAQK